MSESKDPDDRWQSAHDVAAELKWIGDTPDAARAVPRRNRRDLLWGVALLGALLAAIGIAAWLATRPRPAEAVIESAITTDGNSGLHYTSGPPALSPDGTMLAYVANDPSGRRMLWLRSMDRGVMRPLAGTEDAGLVWSLPVWSPDGRFLAFSVGGELKKIAIASGQIETIAPRLGGTTWNRDDVILVPGLMAGGPIQRIRASGGEPAVVLDPASIGAKYLGWPTFLPDGKRFLFLALGGEIEKRRQEGIWAGWLDGSERPQFLVRAVSHAIYVEPGFLLFARDGVLRAQRFDAKTLRLHGDATVIAPVQTFAYSAYFTASSSGLLAYQPAGAQLSELVLKKRDGTVVRTLGSPAFYWAPRFSPDGSRVAVDLSDERAGGDIWLFTTADGRGSRFTFDSRNETAPVWSPSGEEIVYEIDLQVERVVPFRKRIGGGSPQLLFELPKSALIPSDWSPDGRFVALTRTWERPDVDVVLWSFSDRRTIEFAASPADEATAVFSPDSKWIAYQSGESGRSEIYVQPVPPTGAKYQVSTGGGSAPRWSRQDEIFWVDRNNLLHAATVTTTPAFQTGTPATLFTIDQRDGLTPQYDVAADGTFVVNTLVRGPGKPMTLLVNWHRRFE